MAVLCIVSLLSYCLIFKFSTKNNILVCLEWVSILLVHIKSSVLASPNIKQLLFNGVGKGVKEYQSNEGSMSFEKN